MRSDNRMWRVRLFAQRVWQPTSACMTCMAGGIANVVSVAHWEIALRTGLLTGVLALVLSVTPLARVFRHRYGNAAMVAALSALGDAISHPGTRPGHAEALVTGLVAGLLALLGSFVFEDRARRLRAWWAHLSGRPTTDRSEPSISRRRDAGRP